MSASHPAAFSLRTKVAAQTCDMRTHEFCKDAWLCRPSEFCKEAWLWRPSEDACPYIGGGPWLPPSRAINQCWIFAAFLSLPPVLSFGLFFYAKHGGAMALVRIQDPARCKAASQPQPMTNTASMVNTTFVANTTFVVPPEQPRSKEAACDCSGQRPRGH